MKNGWWEHTPEWKRRKQRLDEAHERFREKARCLEQLEDQGIARGQMWEHANRAFWKAGHNVTALHRELWEWERRMGRPPRRGAKQPETSHKARVEMNRQRVSDS